MRTKLLFFFLMALFVLLLAGCPVPSGNGESESLVEMARIPGGSFNMGSPESVVDSFDDERPVRSVTLSAFLIGKYEVTQEQYRTVMGSNPSYFDG